MKLVGEEEWAINRFVVKAAARGCRLWPSLNKMVAILLTFFNPHPNPRMTNSPVGLRSGWDQIGVGSRCKREPPGASMLCACAGERVDQSHIQRSQCLTERKTRKTDKTTLYSFLPKVLMVRITDHESWDFWASLIMTKEKQNHVYVVSFGIDPHAWHEYAASPLFGTQKKKKKGGALGVFEHPWYDPWQGICAQVIKLRWNTTSAGSEGNV